MTRLVLGAKCSVLMTPAFFAAGLDSAAPRLPLSNEPSASAPSPVELRARKARREASVFRSSIQFMASACDRFVKIKQDVGDAGHGGEVDGVKVVGTGRFADGEQLFRSLL